MTITFQIDGTRVVYKRNHMTGSATLTANGHPLVLQSALDPTTHITFSLKQTWHCALGRHKVTIEKTRPLLLPALRPHTYRILVNDHEIVCRSGF